MGRAFRSWRRIEQGRAAVGAAEGGRSCCPDCSRAPITGQNGGRRKCTGPRRLPSNATVSAAMTPSARQSALLASAGRYLAGGGLGLFVLPPEVNLVIARGEGSHVWDVAGREYIDYHLSSGPALLGHGHPAITAAVAAQLPKGTTYYFLNEPESCSPAAGRGHSLRRGRPLHGLGHRGHVLRAAHRPRLRRPHQDAQVRGRLARHARLRPLGHRAPRRPTIRARSPIRPACRRRPATPCWSRRSTTPRGPSR